MMYKTVISITHTNYMIKSSGTEKFVKEASALLRENSYRHLNFFCFYENDKLFGEKLVGVNLDDCFKGIYKYADLIDLVDLFSKKYSLEYVSIELHHLLNHDIDTVKKMVLKLAISTFVFFHDFYNVCGQTNFLRNGVQFCGTEGPSPEKCCDCFIYKKFPNHFMRFKNFLIDIRPFLRYLIAPSNFVTGVLKSLFPEYDDIIVVRPHLIVEGVASYQRVERPIRIVFCGAQRQHKGYNEWKRLVNLLSEQFAGIYSFYYLGTGDEQLNGVTNVYTSISEQGGDAMKNSIREIGAHIAFLWSECPETYSYVYYENSVNGVFVLTNDISGNISSEVSKNKNGIVFHSFDDALNWLQDANKVISQINFYRSMGEYRPNTLKVNESPTFLVSEGKVYWYRERSMRLIHKKIIPDLLYRFGHRKELYALHKEKIL